MSIDIDVEERDPADVEPVNLGASSYEFAYPKVSPLLAAQQRAATETDDATKASLMMAAQDRWLQLGFGPTQWAHIQARLEDDTDALDFRHMQALFTALFEKAAQNRPPMWRGDSSRVSPQAFKREVEQSPLGSMSDPSPLPVSVTS